MCRRVEAGSFASREDTNSVPFYLHHVEGGRALDWSEYRSASEGRAGPEVLNNVYLCLLDALELEPRHRDQLLKRGLTAEEVEQRCYRTLPPAGHRKIAEAVLDKVARLFVLPPITRDKVLKVPGFTTTDGDRLTVVPTAGLLIPLADSKQRIVGIKVRLDRPGRGGKYLYLSSARYGGPGPGAVLHYPPPEWHRGYEDVRITEGELKADVATARTRVKTFGVNGCSGWRMALAVCDHPLVETVRLAFDSDAVKNPTVARNLLAAARAVREMDQARRAEDKRFGVELVLETWDPQYKGIDDLLAADGTPEEHRGEAAMRKAEEIARAAGVNVDGQADDRDDDKRVVIELTPDLHEDHRQAANALADHPLLYQRGRVLVRVVRDVTPRGSVRRGGLPRIEALPLALVPEHLTAVAIFVKKDRKGVLVPVEPPDRLVSAVASAGRWPGVRPLEAVLGFPVLKPDGTVLCSPGYDADTGILLSGLPLGLPAIPDRPTARQVREAVALLLDLVSDFPFERPEHRAAWLAALLSPLARFAYEGPTPLFLADGNRPGVGKGLLWQLIAAILSGRPMATRSYSPDETEMEKRITTLAISGKLTVLLDNVKGYLGGAPLEAALTSTYWEGRILGVSRDYAGPLMATWFCTANNVEASEDIVRRTCPVRLETDLEAPADRTGFKHKQLLAHAGKHRPELLAAALTILRAYCAADRPDKGLKAWGSFEGWSDLVRSAVVWAGQPDPAAARQLLRQRADVVNDNLRALMACWLKLDPQGEGKTASQVYLTLFGANANAALEWEADMRTAIEGLVKKPSAHALGCLLRAHKRKVVGGYFLDTAGKDHQAEKWLVLPAAAFARKPDE
jgi:hypothetical protein